MKFSLFSEETINQFLQRYLEAGKWTKAADMYKKLIALHPENSNFRLRLAEVCLKAGNKKDALEQYQMLAEEFLRLSNLDKAITIYRTMLNLDSTLSHIRIQLAEVYALQGKMDEVWNQYLTAFKYLEEKKLVNQSLFILENMAKLKFKDTKPMVQLAEMFMSRNLRPQAINQFLATADFLIENKQPQEASKYYKRVLELDPRNREAYLGLEVIQRNAPKPAGVDKAQEPKVKAPPVSKPEAAHVSDSGPGKPADTKSAAPKPAPEQKPKPEKVETSVPLRGTTEHETVAQTFWSAQDGTPTPVAGLNRRASGSVPGAAPSGEIKPAPQIKEEKPAAAPPVAPPPPVSTSRLSVELEAPVQEEMDLELLFSEDKLENLLEEITADGNHDEAEAEEHFELGMLYQSMIMWDAAIEEFLLASRKGELQQKCLHLVGECYEKKGMPRHAQKYQHLAIGINLS